MSTQSEAASAAATIYDGLASNMEAPWFRARGIRIAASFFTQARGCSCIRCCLIVIAYGSGLVDNHWSRILRMDGAIHSCLYIDVLVDALAVGMPLLLLCACGSALHGTFGHQPPLLLDLWHIFIMANGAAGLMLI